MISLDSVLIRGNQNCEGVFDTVFENACDSYIWDGVTYTTGGYYNAVCIDLNGCDSLVDLYLTINNSDAVDVPVSACDSYEWDGVQYNTTGMYTNKYTNFQGCDSVVTLDLTINNSDTTFLPVSACDDSYFWDGEQYDTTGMYTNIYTNFQGCDSVVTLDLTINNSDTTFLSVSACDSYTWTDGTGLKYTESGTYNKVTNSEGCDSTLILNLTINSCSNFNSFIISNIVDIIFFLVIFSMKLPNQTISKDSIKQSIIVGLGRMAYKFIKKKK
jgi:trimeric autotransporter adhesin